MKVAMYYGYGDIRYEDVSIPEIGRGEILVRMGACGLCGTDLMDWYIKGRAPLVLGHELSGVVVATGDYVKSFKQGDHVFVHHHVACLTCNYCIHGVYTMCNQFRRTNIDPGGFSAYFRVPSPIVKIDTLKLQDKISFEEAALIEPIACCIRSLAKCNVKQGDNVVVIGAGPSGIIHLMLLKKLGVGKIIVSELVDYRLKAARRFGADVTVNPRKENFVERIKEATDGKGADVVIVAAPNIAAMSTGINICSKGGTLCLFAPTSPKEYLRLSPNKLFFSEIQIISSYSASHVETRLALKLIAMGRLNVKKLITHRFPLSQTSLAFKTAIKNKESLKIVVRGEK